MKTRHMRESLVLCAALWTFMVIHESSAFSLQMSSTKTAVIAGATGYIGKSVVRESVRQGYKTVALVRDKTKVTSKEGEALYGQFLDGADVVECDVCDPVQLAKVCTACSIMWILRSQSPSERSVPHSQSCIALAFTFSSTSFFPQRYELSIDAGKD